jgi:putative ABC transport system substrate-binding protein
MTSDMQRREFITLLGGAAVAWPLAARAQQPAMPVIGFLSGRSRETDAPMLAGFRKGLAETGYVENRNVEIDFRFANGEQNLFPALVADLVRRKLAVIVTVGSNEATNAARAADPNVPIVFNTGNDPVELGFVASFNRPGGNTTGIYSSLGELTPKMLGLLHDLAPNARVIATFIRSDIPTRQGQQLKIAQDAAATLGLQIRVLRASTESELDEAFANLIAQPPDALLVPTNQLLISRAQQLALLAARLRVPAIYGRRNFAAAGGLMSYGDNVEENYRYTGIYVGRILKGEKPADLPVFQVTKLEFVINLRTAKALSFIIPPGLLAIADEVIE